MAASGLRSLRPKVIANFAITWDGRISTRNRTPANFSSPADKRRLLEIRAEADAVLASATTVEADTMTMGLPDPALRARRVACGQGEYPLRVLVSGSGAINPELRIFSETVSPVVVFSTDRMPAKVKAGLEGRAALRLDRGPLVDLQAMLQVLKEEFGVQSVVCEGGGRLFNALLSANLVDELCLTVCPRVFGGQGGVTLTGTAAGWFPSAVSARLMSFEPIGGECFTRWSLRG